MSSNGREWFTQQQAAAEVLLIAEGTLSRYVRLGIAPRSVKIGNGRRFHRDWLAEVILEGGVTVPSRAAILHAANKTVPTVANSDRSRTQSKQRV